MQRKSFGKQCLIGIGYVFLGNILCFIVTLATGAFLTNVFFKWLLILITFLVFFSLVFTAAWKAGYAERTMMKNHRIDAPLPNRWIWVSFIAGKSHWKLY